jgi:hypothetical protein
MGASVVRFEDALERYRYRRLTAEEEALGLLRVSVLHASLCSRVVDRDIGTIAIVRWGRRRLQVRSCVLMEELADVQASRKE